MSANAMLSLWLAAVLAGSPSAQPIARPRQAAAVHEAAVEVASSAREEDYYAVDRLSSPEGDVLEIGGLDFLPDGRLALSTRRGQVWLVEHALAADPREARFHLFAEGLSEGLGLAVVDGVIHVLQRGELSRLVDLDGDGGCDRIETLSDGWGVSGNYHEFAFGLPRNARGDFFVSLNVAFLDPEWWHGKSPVPWRGWVLRIDRDGAVHPFASGFRSPAGPGTDADGELYVTDNQGDWMPACPLFHVREGGFHGHPASLAWHASHRADGPPPSSTVPPAQAAERVPPAAWLPYSWSRSAGNPIGDTTGGKFGPFARQMFVPELTNGLVLRADLEEVRGEKQGAVFLFRQEVGSAVRAAFAPDGTLFLGCTNRGWGGVAPADGITRVRWRGVAPMEMRRVRLLQDGFEIAFTRPLAREVVLDASDVQLSAYDYDYWWKYGSPERNTHALRVRSLETAPDRASVRVRAEGLEAGWVVRGRLSGVVGEGGHALLHDEFAYTVNQLPEGPLASKPVARVVPPPAGENVEQGWLRLSWGDALGAWHARGWELCSADLDPADPRKLATRKGSDALVNTGEAPGDFTSRAALGDYDLRLSYLLPEGGDSGVLFHGRYELRLCERNSDRPSPDDCGGLAGGPAWDGRAPLARVLRGAGRWHDLDATFRAPRFDASGARSAPATLEQVRIDGQLLHERVELEGMSSSSFGEREVARGPLVLLGTRTKVAFGNIRVRPLDLAVAGEGWKRLAPAGDRAAWRATPETSWSSGEEDGIVAEGAPGSLIERGATRRDFELSASVKLGDGARGALVLRAREEGDALEGYRIVLDANGPGPDRTGSVGGLAPLRTYLVGQETWFDLEVRCQDEREGTRIQVRLGGVLVNDFLDSARRFDPGAVGWTLERAGTRIEVLGLRVRELAARD